MDCILNKFAVELIFWHTLLRRQQKIETEQGRPRKLNYEGVLQKYIRNLLMRPIFSALYNFPQQTMLVHRIKNPVDPN